MKQIVAAAQLYTVDSKGKMLPCGWDPTVTIPSATANDLKNWWCNILVDGGYLNAADSKGKGPVTSGVFFCPSGSADIMSIDLTGVANVPTDRKDQRGAMAYRFWSVNGTTVDCWYGMNGSEGSVRTAGFPARRIPANSIDGLMPITVINKSADMVIFYDGLIYHLGTNGSRVNARHAKQSITNLAFFDGHAESIPTADLPGGLNGSGTTPFSSTNLVNNYKQRPYWVLEQQ